MRFLLLVCFYTLACNDYKKTENIISQPLVFKSIYSKPSYSDMKKRVAIHKNKLDISGFKNDYSFLEKEFVAVITDSIMPYWYGTEWDFNGTTQEPGKGAIACGYFVSTVLRDAGVPLNRVNTGQSASQGIVRQFADKKNTKIFSDKPLDSSLAFIQNAGKGLFIIGLDFHVGFLYYDGKDIWFIHSKWASPKAVVKEDAKQSGILYYSKYRIIGKISNNKKLLDSWLNDGRQL